MHDAPIVILQPIVGGVLSGLFIKVMPVFLVNVFVVDCDVLVSVRPCLLVMETNGMRQFMHNETMLQANK